MPIITNSANRIVIHTRDVATDTVTLANGVYNSKTPTGYQITKIIWANGNGTTTATVSRNTTQIFKAAGNGTWDLSAMGIALTANADQSIVVACANGTVIVEAKKIPAGDFQ